MKTGLASVTFRTLSCEEMIALAVKSGLNGLEWGGDIHCPTGAYNCAQRLGEQTRAAGLEVLSYGSYYRLGQGMDPGEVVRTAKCLGAPIIRIWAGGQSAADTPDSLWQSYARESGKLCEIAAQAGITVATEYHRGTVTDSAEGALKLLRMCGGLKTYWQPNPDLTFEENQGELTAILPYLCQVHTFHWIGSQRIPLREGARMWKSYISLAKDTTYILEFVKDDNTEQLLLDAEALKEFVHE